MSKKRVLVFPCGSEIGLEIHRALEHSKHFELWGASSVSDHGEVVFYNYIPDVLPVDHPGFVTDISVICEQYKIDYIFPAHDDVTLALSNVSFSAEVVAPNYSVCNTCRSKTLTYDLFPEISPGRPGGFPAFAKPDRGQGSVGAGIVNSEAEVAALFEKYSAVTVLEYLPGPEFTVDCFTDRFGKLRFCEGRSRDRIKNGIAVRTSRVERPEFRQIAELIMGRLKMRGQWFFQVKERADGELCLLEIAPRVAGSSGLWRAYGVNLPECALLDRMLDSEIPARRFRLDTGIKVFMDRALDTAFKVL